LGLCPLATRISLFAPRNVDLLRQANPGLVDAIARGQELLVDLLPADVGEAVARCSDDPAPLAAAMAAGGTTLLHGDFFLPNLALADGVLVPLDWGLATEGPSALDLITFCVGAMSNVELCRSALVGEARRACRDLCDDETFARCEFWALMELGWNKALDAIDHADPAKRATERADLEFWVDRARAALDAGVVPDRLRSRGAEPSR
jgi:hypothetical protein